jgi:hypothetical protein
VDLGPPWYDCEMISRSVTTVTFPCGNADADMNRSSNGPHAHSHELIIVCFLQPGSISDAASFSIIIYRLFAEAGGCACCTFVALVYRVPNEEDEGNDIDHDVKKNWSQN